MYDRLHTREIGDYGGVVNQMPIFAAIMLFFSMANIALPGSSAFIGEIMVLVGTFAADPVHLPVSAKWIAMAATISVVLSACYTLWMYKRVIMGDVIKDTVRSMGEITKREFALFVPLMLLTLWVGFYPVPVLDLLHESVAHLIEQSTTTKLGAAALIEQATALNAAAH
jgi:NADH-quinone oxidoreductase subunit M